MVSRRLGVIGCALLSLLLAQSGFPEQIPDQPPNISADRPPNGAPPSVTVIAPQSKGPDAATSSQVGTIDSSAAFRPQPSDDRTLEIWRQHGSETPLKNETAMTREFKPSQDEASIDDNFKTGQTEGRAPYLGIRVAETSRCFLGREEHGLEVLSVIPGSPADKAGLSNTGGFSVPGSVGEAIFIPVGLLAHALLNRAGMPGYSGDLIVAVNDRRVHDKAELDGELSKLKPGDSAYLTLIRPLRSGAHQTVRVFITVGDWHTEAPLASAGHTMGPARFDSSGNLSYDY